MKMFGELRLVRALTDEQIAAMRDPKPVTPRKRGSRRVVAALALDSRFQYVKKLAGARRRARGRFSA